MYLCGMPALVRQPLTEVPTFLSKGCDKVKYFSPIIKSKSPSANRSRSSLLWHYPEFLDVLIRNQVRHNHFHHRLHCKHAALKAITLLVNEALQYRGQRSQALLRALAGACATPSTMRP
jgi:hypothetical protein